MSERNCTPEEESAARKLCREHCEKVGDASMPCMQGQECICWPMLLVDVRDHQEGRS